MTASVPGHQREAEAKSVTAELARVAAVPRWWARRARLAGLPSEWQDWRRALSLPPVDLARLGAQEEASHLSAHAFGEAYVEALDRLDRARHGRHYTPRLLADALWTEIDRAGGTPADGSILDPACGTGALLLRPLRRFVRQRLWEDPKSQIEAATTLFRGVDTDALAVWIGNALLAAELLPLWARVPAEQRSALPSLLQVGDGLRAGFENASVIVMNPPYGRANLAPAARERWRATLYGHANWYGLFLHAAVETTPAGSIIAAVLPASFLGGAYFQRLRMYLSEEAPLIRLRRIHDRAGVFASGVQQETCLAIFRKGGHAVPIACSVQTINGRVSSASLGTTRLLDSAPDLPWILPRSRADRALVAAAAEFPHRLRDFGWQASTGPLVWNRHKSQISVQRSTGAVPILWAADIEAGAVRRSVSRDSQRWITLREKDEHMRLTSPAVLVQRTTAPEQPRRLIAARLERVVLDSEWGGVAVVENHMNVLRCDRADSPLTPALLEGLLNTRTWDRLYRCITGSVAVSAYELAALPLPDGDTLARWSRLEPDELELAVAAAYQ